MRTIRHIPLAVDDSQTIEVLFNSEVLDIVSINNKPYLCIIGDEAYHHVIKRFVICREGSMATPLNCNKSNYRGNFLYEDKIDTVLYHVFEP